MILIMINYLILMISKIHGKEIQLLFKRNSENNTPYEFF